MYEFKLCGYRLGSKGLRVDWADLPYEGYDREHFLQLSLDYDPSVDDGTELWRLQTAYLGKLAYLRTFDEARMLHDGFARHGIEQDVLRIQVEIRCMRDPASLRHLLAATESDDTSFEPLGYDAGHLMGQYSIIYQPGKRGHGFMRRVDETTRARWARRLNEHGLFTHVEDCREFRDLFYQQKERESGEMEILEVAVLRE